MAAKQKTEKKPAWNAKTADKHILYQMAVQAPETDARFFARLYKKTNGRKARTFREDFCGTATLAAHWIKLDKEFHAIGVDLHKPTLEWGKKHNLGALKPEQQERITLYCDDVMNVMKPKADIIAALNFSYSFFMTRKTLLAYMRSSYKALEKDGILFLDSWGGGHTQLEQEDDPRWIDPENGYPGFWYIWDQHKFDPVTYHSTCYIHFEFDEEDDADDDMVMRRAFTYEWRQWTLPELQELMVEAGFDDVHVLWEGTDKETDEGNGVFRRVKRGEADESWIAYVVGKKS